MCVQAARKEQLPAAPSRRAGPRGRACHREANPHAGSRGQRRFITSTTATILQPIRLDSGPDHGVHAGPEALGRWAPTLARGGVKSGGLSHSLSHFAMRESVDSRHGAMGARSIGGVRFPRSQTGTSMTNQPITIADRGAAA